MREIKPIETRYKGYRFRSRLEARWAVFFDALGVDWEYEKEGYDLGDAGWYLPDFWLKNVGLRWDKPGLFVEIKGTDPTESEENKLHVLAKHTGSIALLVGSPEYRPYGGDGYYEYGDGINGWHWDNFMEFMKCHKCGRIKFQYNESNYCFCPDCGERCDNHHPDIKKAVSRARGARFEHGETP